MFNSIKLGSNSQNVTFNTPSIGTLQKSHPKSTFIRFQRTSPFEKKIFPSDGSNPFIEKNYKSVEITVLQVLIFGEDYYLCEIVENAFLTEEK